MVWKGTHLSKIFWQSMSEHKPSHKIQGIVCRPSRQDRMKAQIWRRVQHWKSQWAQWSSSSVHGRTLEPPVILLEQSDLSDWVRRALVKEVTSPLTLQHCYVEREWKPLVCKRHMTAGVCQKAPERLRLEKQNSLIWWNKDLALWSEC